MEGVEQLLRCRQTLRRAELRELVEQVRLGERWQKTVGTTLKFLPLLLMSPNCTPMSRRLSNCD